MGTASQRRRHKRRENTQTGGADLTIVAEPGADPVIMALLAECETDAERAFVLQGVVETADVLYSDGGTAVRAINFERLRAWIAIH